MSDTPPYDLIQESGDRSWSLRLVERLASLHITEEERDEIVWTLERLDDPRAVRPLVNLMTNADYPKTVREAAAQVFILTAREPDLERRHEYWQSGDELLQYYALMQMGPEDGDIIEAVANDPHHPLHRYAITKLSYSFELPRHQDYVITALKHSDAAVRGAAAVSLLWTEANRGEEPLLEATADSDPEVVDDVLAALSYYPTQRVLLRFHQLGKDHPETQIRDVATQRYTNMRDDFALAAASPSTEHHIRRWLTPLWELLNFSPEELIWEPPDPSILNRSKSKKPVTLTEVYAILNDHDASPQTIRTFFWDSEWPAIPPTSRHELIRAFIKHPDHVLRGSATHALQAWNAQDALIEFMNDEDFIVRKAAMYSLGQTVPFRPDIAEFAWRHFEQGTLPLTHAYETLKTYAIHAKRSEALERLLSVADDPGQMETLRYEAVFTLTEWQADEQLAHLMKYLSDDPPMTWTLHIALLDAAAEQHLPIPDLGPLLSVDHLSLQEALAPHMKVQD